MSRMAALALIAGLFGSSLCTTPAYAGPAAIETLGTPVASNTHQTSNIEPSDKVSGSTTSKRLHFGIAWPKLQLEVRHVLRAHTGFPLSSIAPPEFDAGDTWVYVQPHPQFPSD